MEVSNCCGAIIHSSPDGYVISCQCCGVVLDICKDVISQEAPSIEIIEMPEMTEEWREKIIFKKNENI